MEETLITFETAKLAKEKGFDEKCRFIIRDNVSKEPDKLSDFIDKEFTTNSKCANNDYAISTQSLLKEWLRVKHHIDVDPMPGWLMGDRIYECVVWVL